MKHKVSLSIKTNQAEQHEIYLVCGIIFGHTDTTERHMCTVQRQPDSKLDQSSVIAKLRFNEVEILHIFDDIVLYDFIWYRTGLQIRSPPSYGLARCNSCILEAIASAESHFSMRAMVMHLKSARSWFESIRLWLSPLNAHTHAPCRHTHCNRQKPVSVDDTRNVQQEEWNYLICHTWSAYCDHSTAIHNRIEVCRANT